MSLTREQILSTKAGVTLDRLVEEHVFGWIAWQEQRGDYLVVTFQQPGNPEPYKRTQNWKSAMDRYSTLPFSEIDIMKHAVYGDKDFSTDVSEAWKVEEKMLQMSLGVQVRYVVRLKVVCGWEDKQPTTIEDLKLIHATPEQRCKAALLAVLNL